MIRLRTALLSTLAVLYATLCGDGTVPLLQGGLPATRTGPSVYYVAENGDDSSDGSVNRPWRTIQHADHVVEPGDTVVVEDGVYRSDLFLRRSGAAAQPITYTAQHRWKAKLVGTSSGDGSAVVRVTGGRVIIRDFDITGKDANGIILAYAGTAASYNQAVGNYVHDMNTPCTDNSGSAIETGGGDDYHGISHNDIIGNLVVNITPAPGCPRGHPATGIYAEVPYSFIANNIVINAGYAIQSWHAASHVSVVGNTVINNLRSITIGDGDSPGGRINDYSLVQNNLIFYSKDVAIAETGQTGTHNRYVHNLVFGGNTEIQLNHGLQAVGTIGADPRFIDNTGTAFGDYRLRDDSPARGAGLAVDGIDSDFLGSTRPEAGRTDIGACLFNPGVSMPTPEPRIFRVAAGVSAKPDSILRGQSSVLSWTTEDAAIVTLNGKVVPSSGSMAVRPKATTTYKLIAQSPMGQSDWGAATVTVH